MLIETDFSEVSDPIIAGEYRVAISEAKADVYKSGLPYINWTMETVNSENPKDNGRKIFYNTPIKGRAAFMLQKLYHVATGEVPKGNIESEQLIGRQIGVVLADGVHHLTGEPTGYTEVKAVKPVS